MDLFQFVDYCHAQQIPGVELTSYYFPKAVTHDYLIQLKQHCHQRGVTISGGAIRNDFCQSDSAKVLEDIEHTKKWIDYYAILGAPAIRIFAGKQPKGDEWEPTIARCVAACDIAANYAATKGIYLALENHGGVTEKAEGLLEIVRRVQSKSLGINFDSGNFHATPNPYLELEQIAPYAVNAQIKVRMTVDGKKQDADIPRVVSILKQAGYSGWVALEYEEAEDPMTAIPKWIQKIKAAI
jgi:sugar phosphate isomerase/epimerase